MAWEEWQDPATASLWNSVLDVIEDAARQFSENQKPNLTLSVIRASWDAPDVELSWGPGEVKRNIHIVVNGRSWPLEISIEGAAWEDLGTPERPQRMVKLLAPRKYQAPDVQHVKTYIPLDIQAVFREVQSLSPRLAAVAQSG